MRNVCAIILTAGDGTCMRSQRPNLFHPLLGRPLIHYLLEICLRFTAERVLVVVGPQVKAVQQALGRQPVELVPFGSSDGTGHAILQIAGTLDGFRGTLLVLRADTPLLTERTLRALVAEHEAVGAAATLLITGLPGSTGCEPIFRDELGRMREAVKEIMAPADERVSMNGGCYCFDARALLPALRELSGSSLNTEFFAPKVLEIFFGWGAPVHTFHAPDPAEVLRVNSGAELAAAAAILRQRVHRRLMDSGVTLLDLAATYIDDTVAIGSDTVIYPGVTLQGTTTIGAGCVIYPHCRIQDSRLADGVTVLDGSIILGSDIADGCVIGPYAHLRRQSRLKAKAKVGNFCEVKRALIGEGAKVPHLSYIGDATLGAKVNIGAGTITCNYDGFAKHETIIEDDVFVGSNTNLVAPITVGKGAIVAAGSTITETVPPDAVVFGRAPQVTKEGRAMKTRQKQRQRVQGS